MSYSGFHIKENATIDDFKEIIRSVHQGLLGMREREAEMKILYEERRKADDEAYRLYIESGGTGGRSGCSGFGSSNNSKEYISVMVGQAYYVANKCPSNWINMWEEEFKDDPEVLLLLNRQRKL